jgi:hypothetical protein
VEAHWMSDIRSMPELAAYCGGCLIELPPPGAQESAARVILRKPDATSGRIRITAIDLTAKHLEHRPDTPWSTAVFRCDSAEYRHATLTFHDGNVEYGIVIDVARPVTLTVGIVDLTDIEKLGLRGALDGAVAAHTATTCDIEFASEAAPADPVDDYRVQDRELIVSYPAPETRRWAPSPILAISFALLGVLIYLGGVWTYDPSFAAGSYIEYAIGGALIIYGVLSASLGQERYRHIAQSLVDGEHRPPSWGIALFLTIVGIAIAGIGFAYAGHAVVLYPHVPGADSFPDASEIADIAKRAIVGLIVMAVGAIVIRFNAVGLIPPHAR